MTAVRYMGDRLVQALTQPHSAAVYNLSTTMMTMTWRQCRLHCQPPLPSSSCSGDFGTKSSPTHTCTYSKHSSPQPLSSLYRAMQYVHSAVLRLHGVCLSVRLSVCLSVCLSVRLSVTLVDCDHIAWKSWKLIARTISPTPSLFGPQTPSTYFQGNMGKFWGD